MIVRHLLAWRSSRGRREQDAAFRYAAAVINCYRLNRNFHLKNPYQRLAFRF